MKFAVKMSNLGRSGCLSELPKPWHCDSFKTPTFMTYTKAGTIPHLTFNTMQRLDNQKMIFLQTLPSTVEFKEAVEAHGKGLNDFVGLPEYPFHLSMQDPGTTTPTGYNVNKGVSVWCGGGKKLLNVEQFMQTIKAFHPVSYQALCDSDTPQNCSKKRLNKAVDNSLRFLDSCLAEHRECSQLSDVAIFGPVQGGYDSFLRKKSAEATASRSVDGFVIDGFHINGTDIENVDFSKVKQILSDILPILTESKPRILQGAFAPEVMIEAIKCGIDIFDSSYVSKLTEAGEGFVFPLSAISDYFSENSLESAPKRSKYTSVLKLSEDLYKADLSPVVEGCNCYTCQHYTRAYIHHLIATSELLAQILLTIHNLNHFAQFFQNIRNCMAC